MSLDLYHLAFSEGLLLSLLREQDKVAQDGGVLPYLWESWRVPALDATDDIGELKLQPWRGNEIISAAPFTLLTLLCVTAF